MRSESSNLVQVVFKTGLDFILRCYASFAVHIVGSTVGHKTTNEVRSETGILKLV